MIKKLTFLYKSEPLWFIFVEEAMRGLTREIVLLFFYLIFQTEKYNRTLSASSELDYI